MSAENGNKATGMTANGEVTRHLPTFDRPVRSNKFGIGENYDWLGAMVRRKSIVIFMLTISSLVGYLNYIGQPKVYTSDLKLMIFTHNPPRSVHGETMVQEVSVGKHENLLMSELVLAKAIKTGDLASLKTFNGQPEPFYSLRKMISVEPVEDAAETLVLSATGLERTELPTILTAIVTSYQEVLTEDSASIGQSSVELIQKLQEQMVVDKSTAESEYYALVSKLGLSPSPDTGQFVNPHAVEVDDLTTQMVKEERRVREVEERIKGVRQLKQLPPEKQKVVALEAAKYLQISESSGGYSTDAEEIKSFLKSLDARIAMIERDIALLISKGQKYKRTYGNRHPIALANNADLEFYNGQLATLLEQRRTLQDNLGKVTGTATSSNGSPYSLSNFDTFVVQTYLAALEREVDQLRSSIESYRADIEIEQKTADLLRTDIEKVNLLAREISQKGTAIKNMVDQLSELTVLAGNYTSTKVRVIDNPTVGYQVAPKFLTTLAIFIFAGGLLGVGLALLLDLSDLAFRSPEEIRDRLGVPVLAKIEKMSASKHAPMTHSQRLVTLDRPKSAIAEAYRSCRTSLLFMAKERGLKVFLITSGSAGDGKSTTAMNLAMSFAQVNLRTVIIDADLRRPTCHANIGIDASPGLKDYSQGTATVEHIIRPCELQPNLSIVTAGGHFQNPSTFLGSPQFKGLLDKFRATHDVVIVDSPPVLPVADAMALSALCDGVLLVVRIRKGVVLSATKAVETLRSVNANLLGVVVNQVDKNSHYSEYGQYGYNGYGGYSYYAGRYYDRQNAKYYESSSRDDGSAQSQS